MSNPKLLEMKTKKILLGLLTPKYGKFWSISLDNFIKQNPHISEECIPLYWQLLLYEREVHNFNWQGLGGWPKSIPHIVLVVHLHNLHAKPQLIMIIIIDCFLDLHSLTSFTKISVKFFPHIWEFLKVSLHNYGWFHIEKSTNWTKK